MNWPLIVGLGALWLGGLIVWVAPVPRQLRRTSNERTTLDPDAAFLAFWLDQYGWIGITLSLLGVVGVSLGLVLG